MENKNYQASISHTKAWIAQTWISFLLAISLTSIGILYLPVNNWIKGYLGMGLFFSIGSTISLSKTIRDVEDSRRIINRVDEAKLERLLAEHDPYKS